MSIAFETLDAIQKKVETARIEYDKLRQELSIADRSITDILHELEFAESLSAYQGYKFSKLLKTLSENRRIIKNEVEAMQLFIDKFNGFDLDKIQRALLNLETNQEKRLYTPKVLTPEKLQEMLNVS